MIRLLAILTMVLDHMGIIFFPKLIILRILGRLSFPMFAWGIAKGYRYTKSVKLYAIRLLILAGIAQVPYYFLFHNGLINVCFTLLDGLIILALLDSKLVSWLKYLSILGLLIVSQVFHFDYGMYGLLMIVLFFIFEGKDSVVFYQAALTVLSVLVFRFDPIQSVAIFSPLIILFLQNRDFKLNRAFQYSIYPAHLFLFLAFLWIGGSL